MKIVLTGGTHTGKTSILKYLQSKGYKCLDEVAGENMKNLIELFGMDEYRSWRKNNFLEFQCMNIFSNFKREIKIKNDNLVFLDRGIFDWIASLKRENVDIPNGILKLVEKIKYDYIFIIDSINIHNIREETGRMLTKELSKKWNKFIIQEYTSIFGDEKVIHVPFDTIENRANFILKKLGN